MKIEPVALRELAESDMFSMTEVYVALNSAADTIDTLRAEVEAHKLNIDLIKDCAAGSLNMGRGLIAEYAARSERAEAEAEALRKDAERYRWLRQNEDWTLDGIVRWHEGYEPINASHEVLDAAIDIARQEKQ